ncbi:beta-ketoacyl synthase N-terminal-like domain-containing protein [Dyadobacter sp. CY312]|uniref:beta-ketoacyl synthase N-terminal-like domain-containing protein n=1 Tax=Dyadobacter sp. CY312 TaxID=2907303 RepID=UPI001F45C2AC|nr:beta-ketoacyl synthase N-terminal-like domain-containing protein [Dyadobacter sp. CY312]MCE7041531.1 beta-ketoacyl synthase [Dyadobacter sp. CY312]
MIYIGAEEMISPLGNDAKATFSAVSEGLSGISLVHKAGLNQTDIHLATIPGLTVSRAFENLIVAILKLVANNVDPDTVASDRTLVIISSTKGGLKDSIADPFADVADTILQEFNLAHQPLIISNACISGVLAINTAGNFVRSGHYDHVIVIGCDVISDFVIYGFQSLFAVSDKPCAPFDSGRAGVTLGEACSAVVISNNPQIYRDRPYSLLIGTSANDANHISGPSRTGEGLYRSVSRTMAQNGISPADIDFISAHGTGTLYNDEMESIAFDRLGLVDVPLNSLKGYFGHTLGAAGVLETAVSIQSMRNGLLLKSMGYIEKGTSVALNVIEESKNTQIRTVLKTASGFGGGNASLLIQDL